MTKNKNHTKVKRLFEKQTLTPSSFHSVSVRTLSVRNKHSRTQSTHRRARLEPAIRDAQKLTQNIFSPCTSVGIDNKASKPIISSYFIRAIDQIFWKLSPYWAFVLLGWYGFAYFWSKTTFINGGRVFQGLWQCRVLNTAMLVLRERTTLSLNKISVFFLLPFWCVCVFAVAIKSGQRVVHFLIRSLV